ncbi:MAG: helix-turn-helix domain-containing protein [Thermacetogeniaceae bacterium]
MHASITILLSPQDEPTKTNRIKFEVDFNQNDFVEPIIEHMLPLLKKRLIEQEQEDFRINIAQTETIEQKINDLQQRKESLFSVPEAAEILGLKPSTVSNKVGRREIKCKKDTGRTLIPKGALIQWLRNNYRIVQPKTVTAADLDLKEKAAFTVRDMSLLTGVSTQTIYEAIQRREFPGCKIGGRMVIFKDDFIRWKENGGIIK